MYDAVKEWVLETYPEFEEKDILRPFWPGADYTKVEYPDGCLVMDNPPWSIMAAICRWYTNHKINYFLFANHVTHFSELRITECHAVVAHANIRYENGARISTSFLTNLGPKIRISGELKYRVDNVQGIVKSKRKAYHPSYNIVSGAQLGKFATAGYNIDLPSAQFEGHDNGYRIFGGGCRLSDDDAKTIKDLQRALEESDRPTTAGDSA